MYTHLHTIEWNFMKDVSTDRQKYFYNRIDGRYLAEVYTKSGIEYYICSDVQVSTGNLGIYIGCVADKPTDRNYGHKMVCDHEIDTEATISVNDDIYL